jgi:hypothetical protein
MSVSRTGSRVAARSSAGRGAATVRSPTAAAATAARRSSAAIAPAVKPKAVERKSAAAVGTGARSSASTAAVRSAVVKPAAAVPGSAASVAAAATPPAAPARPTTFESYRRCLRPLLSSVAPSSFIGPLIDLIAAYVFTAGHMAGHMRLIVLGQQTKKKKRTGHYAALPVLLPGSTSFEEESGLSDRKAAPPFQGGAGDPSRDEREDAERRDAIMLAAANGDVCAAAVNANGGDTDDAADRDAYATDLADRGGGARGVLRPGEVGGQYVRMPPSKADIWRRAWIADPLVCLPFGGAFARKKNTSQCSHDRRSPLRVLCAVQSAC